MHCDYCLMGQLMHVYVLKIKKVNQTVYAPNNIWCDSLWLYIKWYKFTLKWPQITNVCSLCLKFKQFLFIGILFGRHRLSPKKKVIALICFLTRLWEITRYMEISRVYALIIIVTCFSVWSVFCLVFWFYQSMARLVTA